MSTRFVTAVSSMCILFAALWHYSDRWHHVEHVGRITASPLPPIDDSETEPDAPALVAASR